MADSLFLASRRAEVLESATGKGCVCPVCDQFVKAYKRRITSSAAAGLIWSFSRYGINQPFHIRDMAKSLGLTSTGDFAKLRFWGLIDEVPHVEGEDGKKHGGQWVITKNGELFVRNMLTVREYFVFYNNKIIDKSAESVSIKDALKQKFDYNDLMKGV